MIRTDQPCSNTFSCAILDGCWHVLPWRTCFLLMNSGCFSTKYLWTPCSCWINKCTFYYILRPQQFHQMHICFLSWKFSFQSWFCIEHSHICNQLFFSYESRLGTTESALFLLLRARGMQTSSLMTFFIFSMRWHMVDCNIFLIFTNSWGHCYGIAFHYVF